MQPIVLDLDGSVGPLPNERRIALRAWQEAVRFGCGLDTLSALRAALSEALPRQHGTVFVGSGDFHHVTLELVRRCHAHGPFDVVVFDNHPDNMRFLGGVHCGSWVRRVALLPFVRTVHVVGITSPDASTARWWQNYLAPLWRGKLTYWCIGVDTAWARRLGLQSSVLGFDTPHAMLDRFAEQRRHARCHVYVSIDKDVLAPGEAHTNWDQGVLTVADLLAALRELQGCVIASDVTGDVSLHRYASRWKRLLSAMDRQPAIEPARLTAWQSQQHEVNLRILRGLEGTQAG